MTARIGINKIVNRTS